MPVLLLYPISDFNYLSPEEVLNTVYPLWSFHQSIDSTLAIQGCDLGGSTKESLVYSWPPWTKISGLCLSVRMFSGAPISADVSADVCMNQNTKRQQWRHEYMKMGMWYLDGKSKSCYKWASEPVNLLWVHVNAVDLQNTRILKVLNTRTAATLFEERADLHTDMKRLQAEEHSFQAFCSFTLSNRAAEWHFRL